MLSVSSARVPLSRPAMVGHVRQTCLDVLYRTTIENRFAHVVIGPCLELQRASPLQQALAIFGFAERFNSSDMVWRKQATCLTHSMMEVNFPTGGG